MLSRITLLVNDNLYNSKRYFTSKLAEAFERHGIKASIIDPKDGSSQISPNNIIKQNPQLTCSFNSILPVAPQKYLCDLLELPHLSILVDPAVYSLDLVKSPYSILSCVDQFDCDYLKEKKARHVFFWPHAVERELVLENNSDNDRPYDIVFLGSCYDIDEIRRIWQTKFSLQISDLIDRAVKIFLSKDDRPIFQLLVDLCNEQGIDLASINFSDLVLFADYYSRGLDRLKLIQSIKTTAKIHVFGDIGWFKYGSSKGWDHYLSSQSNVVVHPAVSFEDSMQILKKSKICLNSMPFFKNGTHERIFTGLACGSLPITTDNIYIRQNFIDGEDLLLYKFNQYDFLNEPIEFFLANKRMRNQLIEHGKEKILKFHTWDVRVKQLIDLLPKMIGSIYADTIS